jgi:hypothetical protein
MRDSKYFNDTIINYLNESTYHISKETLEKKMKGSMWSLTTWNTTFRSFIKDSQYLTSSSSELRGFTFLTGVIDDVEGVLIYEKGALPLKMVVLDKSKKDHRNFTKIHVFNLELDNFNSPYKGYYKEKFSFSARGLVLFDRFLKELVSYEHFINERQNDILYDGTIIGRLNDESRLVITDKTVRFFEGKNLHGIYSYNSLIDANYKITSLELKSGQFVWSISGWSKENEYISFPSTSYDNPSDLHEWKSILESIGSGKSIDEVLKNASVQLNQEKMDRENTLASFDKDDNGVIDIVENKDFSKLLRHYQGTLLEFEKNESQPYLQYFIKLSKYISQKEKNLNTLFTRIKDTEETTQELFEDSIGLLNNEIHNYRMILTSSLTMITAIVNDDRLTFYEIYEKFDEIGVFNSNWEKEMSLQLENLSLKLDILIYSINKMENSIRNQLDNLTQVNLLMKDDVINSLKEINSTLDFGNLVSMVNAYQVYKINKNTKSLNS